MNIRKWSSGVTSPPPASAGAGHRVWAEPVHCEGPGGPDPAAEIRPAGPGRSAPIPRPESKTLKHQVEELSELVDGAIGDLEQVLRAFRMIERNL
jgi:hypothetical protein